MQPMHEEMQVVFYGSIFHNELILIVDCKQYIFIRSLHVSLRSMMRRRHILIQIVTALFNEDILRQENRFA